MIVDLSTISNPNAVGEVLKEKIFAKDSFNNYSSEINENAYKRIFENDPLYEKTTKYLEDKAQEEDFSVFCDDSKTLIVGITWYDSGSGALVLLFSDKVLFTTDLCSEHDWEWINS